VIELRAIPSGYVVLGWGTSRNHIPGNFEDWLFGFFIADSDLVRISRVMDIVPTPRWGDYDFRIEQLSESAVVVAGKGATYGDGPLRLTYPLEESAEVAARMKAAESIERLAPSAFPQLPLAVRKRLETEGCTVPQNPAVGRPHNVVFGHFATIRQVDWAVLCSVDGHSVIRIFWGGLAGCPPLPLSWPPDWTLLTDGKWTVTIGALPPNRVKQLLADLGWEVRAPIHDGITDRWYCDDGGWLNLIPVS
jgi:hypothetical protein